MKTYLIQLQKFDNLASIIDKMGWAKTRRILLIWPKRGKPLLSTPDVELIKRKAVSLGADVAFVCRDLEIQESANANSISVFQSVTQAESVAWRTPPSGFEKNREMKEPLQPPDRKNWKTKNEKNANPIARFLAILVAGLAVLVLVVFFIPSAVITVYPVLTTKEISIDIWASPEVSEINVNGSLPAEVQVLSLTRTANGQSSGRTGLPIEYATGQAVFTNVSGQPVTIPIGTILIATDESQARFVTLTESVLEPSAVSEPIDIKAIDAGIKGNIDIGMITTIDGQLAGLLEVTNETATTGGEDVEAPTPTEEDYEALKDQMLVALRQEAMNQFPKSDIELITATMDDGTITSEIRTVDPGTASDTFTVTINIDFKGLTYSKSDLEMLVNKAMEASMDSGMTIYRPGVTFESIGMATGNLADGAQWTIAARAETGLVVSESEIFAAVSGKTTSEAKNLIQNLIASRQPVEIRSFPGFWKWMPWMSLNTKIEVR